MPVWPERADALPCGLSKCFRFRSWLGRGSRAPPEGSVLTSGRARGASALRTSRRRVTGRQTCRSARTARMSI